MYQFRYRLYICTNMVSVVSLTRLILIFTLTLFLKINVVHSITSTVQSELSQETAGLRHCNFSGNKQKLYGTSELLQCMNELATNAINHVNGKSFEDKERAFRRKGRPYYPSGYTGRPGSEPYSPYYDSRPGRPIYSGTGQSDLQPDYYPSGIGYQGIPAGGLGALGGTGINLLEALSSIAQYDDYKCVPRILCEMAAGGSPGNGIYKQAGSSTFEDLGKNALFGLLSTIDVGETSPILSFGKAAVLGYSSKGNPEACYQEYRKCPRNSDDLVYYLNNHNGGFFRFFSNIGNTPYSSLQGSYSRPVDQFVSARREPAPPPGLSGPESDRTGTGELKFDNPVPPSRRDYGKSFFPGGRAQNSSRTFAFPGEEKLDSQQPLNRVSKSLVGYQDAGSSYQTGSGHVNPPFFPQDGKDQETNLLYTSSHPNSPNSVQHPRGQNSRISFPKARLYVPDDPINETMSTFTFPDGTKVKINVGFSKLFSEGYKKSLRRSFGNDRGPQPINFDGFNMVNLADVFADKEAQVTQPCDMICHDVRGTPVQFNQIMLNTGTLSTLMSPEMPVLDLSRTVPCEVMCLDRAGERRQASTILSHVLRAIHNGPRVPRTQSNDLSQQNLQDLYRKYADSLNQRGRTLSNFNMDRSNLPYSANYPSVQSTDFQGFDNRQSQILSQSRIRREQERLRDLSLNSPREMESGAQHLREARLISGRKPLRSKYDSQKIKLSRRERQHMNTPIMIGGAQMPMPSGMSYPNIASGPAIAAMPQVSIPMPVSVPLPIPMAIGLMPSLHVMPMLGMRPVQLNALFPCTGPSCKMEGGSPKILIMCGSVVYALPLLLIQIPVCAIILQTVSTPPSIPKSPLQTIKATWRDPGGEDYPRDFPSDNSDIHECVPIKYDKSTDTDYPHVPGLSYSTKKPLKYHKGKKKKLVIITDRGNVTYIKPS
ncbi:uncharacterized protein LOC107274774 [Cephus cinctus]|uniref:Uncharacterized protein LOC107274774 n=1 Tax=Cephus cinctus TaxID=211228 RepID=A0AAJ7CFP9_CEPCN|nr:uncharacterized protein LOC107274774 [Cephus cinctus]